MADIRIIINNVNLAASLDLTRDIGHAVFGILPIRARFERWGDEICFPLELARTNLSRPVSTVQIGDIAYSERWKSFCIFYGRTPLSNDFEIVPNGPVEVIGRLQDDKSALVLQRFFAAYLTRFRRRAARLLSLPTAFAETITIEKS